MLDQLDDYLLPRLRAAGAPLVVVVGGSTGAGKSTLVNSLLGATVTPSGVLRPTTLAPVLVHHPGDAGWFSGDRMLPGLARITAASNDAERAGGPEAPAGARTLRLAASDAVPPGLALIDAPDIDSVVEQNRLLAAQLLAAADLWLWVTTAARYADAVPWDLLKSAALRSAEVALVLDRLDPGTEEPVAAHLSAMLADHGLAAAPVLRVPEAALEDGLLPAGAVSAVANWLTALGGDAEARAAVIARTRDGVTADLLRRAGDLAVAADAQRDADARLRALVVSAYDDSSSAVLRVTSDGTMLRGEVLARWQDVVGTGEFLRAMQARVGSVRDSLVAAVRGRRSREPELTTAIGTGLEAVLLDAAEVAADRAQEAWRADPAGVGLLAPLASTRASADLRAQVAAEIRGWQADVLDLVTREGAGKRTTARALSLGVNGLGAAVMVAVFASTAGLTGVELGIAGGSAVLAQRVLEAVFGDDAVRQLSRTASARLEERAQAVLDAQAHRFTVLLDAIGTAEASGGALRAAADRVVEEFASAAAHASTDPASRPAGWERTADVGRGNAPPGGGALRGAGAPPHSGVLPVPAEGASGAASGARGWWRRLRRGGSAR